jgi:hypothetical protein
MIELTFQGAVATRATTNPLLEQHGPDGLRRYRRVKA